MFLLFTVVCRDPPREIFDTEHLAVLTHVCERDRAFVLTYCALPHGAFHEVTPSFMISQYVSQQWQQLLLHLVVTHLLPAPFVARVGRASVTQCDTSVAHIRTSCRGPCSATEDPWQEWPPSLGCCGFESNTFFFVFYPTSQSFPTNFVFFIILSMSPFFLIRTRSEFGWKRIATWFPRRGCTPHQGAQIPFLLRCPELTGERRLFLRDRR